MNNTIKPGDMFMIVRPSYCCGNVSSLGLIAEAVKPTAAVIAVCISCGAMTHTDSTGFVYFEHESGLGVVDRSRVIKLDPKNLQDDNEHTEEKLTTTTVSEL
ncbi:hypothetical protein IRY61_03740 [Candidatus Saccharibacteria bacterium]|nr:hypothetical protein [Candidatus Saccharibacteria bacterium]